MLIYLIRQLKISAALITLFLNLKHFLFLTKHINIKLNIYFVCVLLEVIKCDKKKTILECN